MKHTMNILFLKVPGLSTDEPKEGIDRPHYVIGHKTSRAEDGGSGIGLITVGAEHHAGHRQTKEWHPIRDSEYEFVSAPKFMDSKGPSAQEINQRAVERVAGGGRISRDDVSSSANLTNIFNPRNIYRQGAERMMENFAGRMDIDPETGAKGLHIFKHSTLYNKTYSTLGQKEKMKSNQVILYLHNQ